MSRDDYLDAMLRHLGAAYYESLHGRASARDVARARDAVEERVDGQAGTPGQRIGGSQQAGTPANAEHRHGRWHRTVRDVMTTQVVTVDRITSFKEIARLLADHKISAVPVLTMGRHVAGVVSEDDLLTARERHARKSTASTRTWSRPPVSDHPRLTAAELMTSPAIVINPDAPVPSAAALMHNRHVKQLPVTDSEGTLLGIVSRRDLLSVFLRPDEQIAGEIREVLSEILLADPAEVSVQVRQGVVTLTGRLAAADQHDLVAVAVRLIWDVDGVVDVVDKLGAPVTA